MAFSAGELANIANAVLDYYIDRGQVYANSLQDKPTLQAMDAAAKEFPGGKGDVSVAVKGQYTTTVAGYTHNDTVTYANPANIKRANFSWKEHHAGISVTLTELKRAGIVVADTMNSASTSNVSEQEQIELANLLEDKLDDMMEGYSRGFNNFLWGDGTVDAKALAGIRSIIKDNPTVGSVGGIDQSLAANSWWRNRASLAIATTAAGEELTEFLHTEMRQLRRYGGRPNLAVAGSAFLDRLSKEIRSKGNYTQTGFARRGATDFGMAEISYNGLVFQYDPTLDDLGTTAVAGKDFRKRCYIIDTSKINLMYMRGEKMKRHSPARPADQYVMYRAITTTAVMGATQLNCHGVYEIA